MTSQLSAGRWMPGAPTAPRGAAARERLRCLQGAGDKSYNVQMRLDVQTAANSTPYVLFGIANLISINGGRTCCQCPTPPHATSGTGTQAHLARRTGTIPPARRFKAAHSMASSEHAPGRTPRRCLPCSPSAAAFRRSAKLHLANWNGRGRRAPYRCSARGPVADRRGANTRGGCRAHDNRSRVQPRASSAQHADHHSQDSHRDGRDNGDG
jgi:hypothetical protein